MTKNQGAKRLFLLTCIKTRLGPQKTQTVVSSSGSKHIERIDLDFVSQATMESYWDLAGRTYPAVRRMPRLYFRHSVLPPKGVT
jgi:hypothetical protein